VNIFARGSSDQTNTYVWKKRFLLLPKIIHHYGGKGKFCWLKTVEYRYSKSRKKWILRDNIVPPVHFTVLDLADDKNATVMITTT
jgi:hypothetical protein